VAISSNTNEVKLESCKNYYLKAFTIYFISFLFIKLFDLIVL